MVYSHVRVAKDFSNELYKIKRFIRVWLIEVVTSINHSGNVALTAASKSVWTLE